MGSNSYFRKPPNKTTHTQWCTIAPDGTEQLITAVPAVLLEDLADADVWNVSPVIFVTKDRNLPASYR